MKIILHENTIIILIYVTQKLNNIYTYNKISYYMLTFIEYNIKLSYMYIILQFKRSINVILLSLTNIQIDHFLHNLEDHKR